MSNDELIVYRLDELKRDIADLKSAMDNSSQKAQAEIKELTARVATLERWRAALIGGSAAVGALAGQVSSWLQHLFG